MNSLMERVLAGGRMHAALVLVSLGLSTGPASAATELSAGVWVDEAKERVYASNIAGFPEARALEDGRLLWVADEPALLLWKDDTRWLALGQSDRRGTGLLLLIDTDSGSVRDRLSFDLPEQVSASVAAEPLRQFDIRAEAQGSSLRLHWSYVAQPLRGALLAADGGAIASEGIELAGVVDVELGTSRTSTRPRTDLQAQPLRPSPDLRADERLPELGARQFRSADAEHAMSPEAQPDRLFGTVWRWQFASRAEGALEGSVELPFALAPFLLLKERLIYQAPPMSHRGTGNAWQHYGPRLVMHDLSQSRELWSLDLLDREFKGVLPP